MMTLVLRYSARSDRGLVRQNNQDAVYAGPRLLALADGMGGHAAGEVASSLVISALVPLDDDNHGSDLLAELRHATVEGNAAITRHVADAPDLEGMGTTLTAILFAGSRLGLVHVGDSRAYQLRGGAFSQITKDDTFVQSLIDEGRITEEEAHTHPQRSLLLRAITGQDVDPTLSIREVRAGDRYLLCSDGLSGVVSDETLADTLTSYQDPRKCADRLIELALRGGGPDNITCIVADVVEYPGEDEPILGGSAGDGSDDGPPPDSAAARASATTINRAAPQRIEPVAPAAPAVPAARRSRRLRVAAIVLVALFAIAGAGALVSTLVLQKYYLGVDPENRVAIFQGLPGDSLGFLPLHWMTRSSCMVLDAVPEPPRREVTSGSITAGSLEDAEDKLRMIHGLTALPLDALQPCAPGATPPSATSTAPASSTPAAITPDPTTSGPNQPSAPPAPAANPQPTPAQIRFDDSRPVG